MRTCQKCHEPHVADDGYCATRCREITMSSLASSAGSATYAQKWIITVEADDVHGAMDAVWECWEAWRKGREPIGGANIAALGARFDYTVTKRKRGSLPHRVPRGSV